MRATGENPRIEVTRHPRGPWLVRVGTRRFAVPAEVGRDLESGVESPEVTAGLGLTGDVRPPGGSRPIWARATLLSGKMTIKLSKMLTPWAGTVCLGLMAISGVTAYLALGVRLEPPSGFAGWSAGFGLILATALWHELGHAAALQREGYPPGGIGVGILFVIPVLWADVTPVAALPRKRRLRVDLAGVCFQLGAGGLCAVGASTEGPGTTVLGMGAVGALVAVIWSLFPFMRTDGYWALCDILGLEDLDRPPPAGSPRALSWFVALFRVANGLFLCWVVLWLPRRIFGLALHLADLAGFDPHHAAVRMVAFVAATVVLGGLALRIWRRIRGLIFS